MSTFRSFATVVAAALHRAGASLGFGAPARLDDLDDRTLADIGVSRSEIESIDAEWRGLAGRTRLRVAIGSSHA